MDLYDLASAWDTAESRYATVDTPVARFNTALLRALKPRWGQTVRPDTSMFTVQFTLPGTRAYDAVERVEVLVDADDRVRMALLRQVPRRGENRPVGPVTITGDYTRPENALPAVEALLYQLGDPDA